MEAMFVFARDTKTQHSQRDEKKKTNISLQVNQSNHSDIFFVMVATRRENML